MDNIVNAEAIFSVDTLIVLVTYLLANLFLLIYLLTV